MKFSGREKRALLWYKERHKFQREKTVIDSRALAEKNQFTTGTLTWENQQNKADYKASASGTNIQGTSTDGKIHGGITPVRTQNVKDHTGSTTKAGVAEGSITITDKEGQKQDIGILNRDTKNSLNKLERIFDKDDVLIGGYALLLCFFLNSFGKFYEPFPPLFISVSI